ncbi:hypothetical protein ABW19_dt0203414 [Dactylella cylindrospora]|nr:hypothetical protein ABW19_dt0203414 [Dactylella cylindrospora]
MDDDDDDFYGDDSPPAQPAHQVAVQDLLSRDNSTPKPTLSSVGGQGAQQPSGLRQDISMNDAANDNEAGEDEEEVEEEEIEVEVEEDDDDVEFIFEPKAGQPVAPPPQGARYGIRTASASVQPQRQPSSQDLREQTTTSSASPAPRTAVLSTAKIPVPRGPTPPPMATSTLDINAIPTHPSTGEKLTSLNIDDLPSKPWRNAGSDITDYFNYGFDEFTWTAYCQKQENTRKDFDPKKMMEDMMMFGNMLDPSALMGMASSGGGGGPGGGSAGNMSNVGTAMSSGMPPLPPGIPPEMAAAMMQQAGMSGMPGMPQMPGMPGMPGFSMDMMGGGGGNTQSRQDMSQMFNPGGQSGFGPQGMNQFQQGMANSYAEEQQRFEQQKYMQQQQRLQQQQQRGFNNPNNAYGNFQNPNAGNQMGNRGRGGPGVQGGAGGNVSQQRGCTTNPKTLSSKRYQMFMKTMSPAFNPNGDSSRPNTASMSSKDFENQNDPPLASALKEISGNSRDPSRSTRPPSGLPLKTELKVCGDQISRKENDLPASVDGVVDIEELIRRLTEGG